MPSIDRLGQRRHLRGALTALTLLLATGLACQSEPGPSGPTPGGASGGRGGAGGAPASTGGAGAATGGTAGSSAPVGQGGSGAGNSGGSAGSGSGGLGGSTGGNGAGNGGGGGGPADGSAASDGAAPSAGGGTPASGPRTSVACGKGLAAPADGYQSLPVAGKSRRFFLRMPTGYDGTAQKAWPVIFGFHGAGEKDGNWYDASTGLTRENRANAVVVLGESLFRPGTMRRSWEDMGQFPENLAYVDATLAWLKEKVCVDPGRFFAVGQSSGAFFSYTLGCHRGDVFRAVAASDGGERYIESCKGNPGAMVRWRPNSAGAGADQKKVRDFWLARNGCGTTRTPTSAPPCVSFGGCQNDVLIWECSDTGSHDWPAYMDKGVWSFFSLFK